MNNLLDSVAKVKNGALVRHDGKSFSMADKVFATGHCYTMARYFGAQHMTKWRTVWTINYRPGWVVGFRLVCAQWSYEYRTEGEWGIPPIVGAVDKSGNAPRRWVALVSFWPTNAPKEVPPDNLFHCDDREIVGRGFVWQPTADWRDRPKLREENP